MTGPTGPWPAYMGNYDGGIDVYIGGTKVAQPVRGINFQSGASCAFDANTGIVSVTVGAGATGAQGATGATGATGAGG